MLTEKQQERSKIIAKLPSGEILKLQKEHPLQYHRFLEYGTGLFPFLGDSVKCGSNGW